MESSLKLYEQWLTDNGLIHNIDEDGDLHFKYQMCNFFILNPQEDDQFLHIILRGSPARGKAHNSMLIIKLLPEAESQLIIEPRHFMIIQNHKKTTSSCTSSSPTFGR